MANTPNIVERGSDGVAFEKPIPASQPGDVFPAGVMLHYAGSAAPTGWLICDGALVSRATYPNLFSAIGTTFGAGDGSTTFGLPDTRGKIPVAKHSSGTFVNLGGTGGEENHLLTVSEMPSHNHGGATGNNSASVSGSTDVQGSHTHMSRNGQNLVVDGAGGDNAGHLWGTAGTTAYSDIGTNAAGSHSHNVSGTASSHGHSISAQGGGTSHNNMPPYIVLNHIIRAY